MQALEKYFRIFTDSSCHKRANPILEKSTWTLQNLQHLRNKRAAQTGPKERWLLPRDLGPADTRRTLRQRVFPAALLGEQHEQTTRYQQSAPGHPAPLTLPVPRAPRRQPRARALNARAGQDAGTAPALPQSATAGIRRGSTLRYADAGKESARLGSAPLLHVTARHTGGPTRRNCRAPRPPPLPSPNPPPSGGSEAPPAAARPARRSPSRRARRAVGAPRPHGRSPRPRRRLPAALRDGPRTPAARHWRCVPGAARGAGQAGAAGSGTGCGAPRRRWRGGRTEV